MQIFFFFGFIKKIFWALIFFLGGPCEMGALDAGLTRLAVRWALGWGRPCPPIPQEKKNLVVKYMCVYIYI
jgi:hypothetical protein